MLPTEKEYLDSSIIKTFRETIDSSPIFEEQEKYKHLYNLICVFMDRIDSSVQFLNMHSDYPKSEEEFINFLVYAAILRDGIEKLFENIFNKKPPYITEKKYFADAACNLKPFFSAQTCPTDDNFFEYIRSMAFAHPYETSFRGDKRPFMQRGEIHYCPWVIVNKTVAVFSGINDGVGIRFYTKLNEESINSIVFSFSKLKEYIAARYQCICNLTKWAKAGIAVQTQQWLQTKVRRDQEPIFVFHDIKNILESRYESTFSIDRAIAFLKCTLSDARNEANVSIFRDAIIRVLPHVCICVDNLDYNGMERMLDILYIRPRQMHQMANYQLEKIFTYLDTRSETIDPNSNEYWGLLQAYEFSQEFAKKWVTINIRDMSYDEIKLLVCTACYLEAKEQEEAKL